MKVHFCVRNVACVCSGMTSVLSCLTSCFSFVLCMHLSSRPVGGAEGEREPRRVFGAGEETGKSSAGGSEKVNR